MSAVRKIVVGIDESAESRAALAWALEEARLRGAEVQALHAWALPLSSHVSSYLVPDLEEQVERSGEQILDEAIAAVVGSGDPGVAIEHRVVRGDVVPVLLEASSEADLLVIGSSHGGVMHKLHPPLGSAVGQCARHAHCTVVVVRAPVSDS